MISGAFKEQTFTHSDIVPGRLTGQYQNGAIGVLGVVMECPDTAPDSSEDYPAAPAGFLFGEGLLIDGQEFVSLTHLCGEPAYIWA